MLPRLTAIASSKSGSQQAVFCASSPPPFCQQGRSFFLYPSSPTGVRQGVHKSSLSATERSAQARRDASPALSSSSAVSFSRQLGNSSQGSSMVQGALLCQRQTHAGTSDRADQAEARDAADAGTGSKQHSSPRVEQASVCMEDQTYTTVAVPVFVMLPLDTVNADGVFRYASSRWFIQSLQKLAGTGIRGVAVDVWWGAVERKPRRYDWSGYRQLFNLTKALGLKIQVVMSFHACGGNVGDNAQIPLPKWVLQVGERDPDIFFTDRPRDLSAGQRNKECVSLFADEEPGLLKGRSPLQCYAEFMRAFRDEFFEDLGDWIEEVVVGCGPCGELRYPSYVETNGWRFPGIGEFQCYDRRALASLARAACTAGHPEWGNSGPHDAGGYNSNPEETGFFCSWGGSWDTPYGRFFLSWYSSALLEHGERMLKAATAVFNTAHTPSASPVSTTSLWPSAKSTSMWDLAATSAGPCAPAARAASMPPPPRRQSAPLLRYQSISSGDETPQQAQQEDVEGGAGAGGSAGAGAAAALRGETPPQQAQQAETLSGGGSPPLGSPSASGGAGSGSSANGSPTCPPSAAAGTAGGVSPVAAQRMQQRPQQQGGGGVSPRQPGPLSPQAPPAAGQPSPMSVGMLSHPPSMASLRSSMSGSVDDLAGMQVGEMVPGGAPVGLTLKVAGVHWWFRTRSHAAELTAGYYNTETHPEGYQAIVDLCVRYGASLTLTCVEMCDSQHPPEALCGPEGLLRMVREMAAGQGVAVAGENALPCFMPGSIDEMALQRVIYNTQPWGTPLQQGSSPDDRDSLGPLGPPSDMISSAESAVPWGSSVPPAGGAAVGNGGGAEAVAGGGGGSDPPSPSAPSQLPPLRAFTFLRLSREMMTPEYQTAWTRFLAAMQKNASRFKTSRSWRQNLGLRQ